MSGTICGMAWKGRVSSAWTSSTPIISRMTSQCMYVQCMSKANHAARYPVNSIEVSSTICSSGKNTAKSRFGVIHNCMFDMHSKVPCIFAIPHNTHRIQSRGSGRRNVASRLHTMMTSAEAMCLDQLVLLQLKAFFVGFYDYIYRFPQKRKPEEGSPRVRELFNLFMMYLETHFKDSRDVTYYASLLNITPKYLNIIAQRITGNTVKALINEYVVMQLKLSLCSGNTSMKMLAGEYNFSDLSFFCRYFKQHTGMTPMQFVKSEAPKRT